MFNVTSHFVITFAASTKLCSATYADASATTQTMDQSECACAEPTNAEAEFPIGTAAATATDVPDPTSEMGDASDATATTPRSTVLFQPPKRASTYAPDGQTQYAPAVPPFSPDGTADEYSGAKSRAGTEAQKHSFRPTSS